MTRLSGCLAVSIFILASNPALAAAKPGPVQAAILEGMPDKAAWNLKPTRVTTRYTESAFGFIQVPGKFTAKGLVSDRSSPLVIRASSRIDLPAGEYRVLLRSLNAARLYVDGKLLVQTKFLRTTNAHQPVPKLSKEQEPGLRLLPVGHKEGIVNLKLKAGVHTFRLEAVVGGQKLRPEVGELCVCISHGKQPFRLLSPSGVIPMTDESWWDYALSSQKQHHERDRSAKAQAQAAELRFWRQRHALARKIWSDKDPVALPKVGMPVNNAIDRFIGKRLQSKSVKPAELADDYTFIRRVYLDSVGVNPSRQEIAEFLADKSLQRRANLIDRLLTDPRWADNWVGYWQDVLAENPGILKPTLNNTGPFRWWIHQAFRDNMPMDRFVSELIGMEGSLYGGGPAGFGLATQNDVPMAAKANIIGKAFLAVNLQCARCHDAPHHPYEQKDTFSLAAMLANKPISVPKSSSVPALVGGRKPRVEVNLKPGVKIPPAWTLASLGSAQLPDDILRNPKSSRERLAAIITSPTNERFAQVMVNRLWQRYLGQGLIDPVDDWHDAEPSHPNLLNYLARELMTNGYDLKHVARLILNSQCYQRQVLPGAVKQELAEDRLFASPLRRRLSAEQVVDSLFAAVGKEFNCEQLTMDPEGRQKISTMLNLGRPRRAWEFASLSNDRDRPALSLPMAQSIIDVLSAFGWRDNRQNPLTCREETPTPLQPLILANGIMGRRITKLSEDSLLTDLCVKKQQLPELIRAVYLHILSRPPSQDEEEVFVELLQEGYEKRKVPGVEAPKRRRPLPRFAVSWSNHLSPEATRIKLALEEAVRAGDPPTKRLYQDWRERMEDMVWALVNSPEFMFVP